MKKRAGSTLIGRKFSSVKDGEDGVCSARREVRENRWPLRRLAGRQPISRSWPRLQIRSRWLR